MSPPIYLKPDGQRTWLIQWKSPHGASSSEWIEWRCTNSGSAALIDTVLLSSAPQPLRLSALFHQFLLKIFVKTCFGLSVPRLSTVIFSLMMERSLRCALFRIDAYRRGVCLLSNSAVPVTAFESPMPDPSAQSARATVEIGTPGALESWRDSAPQRLCL